MPAVVVVGAQWGDEAKGKVVDLLAQQADVVVRYAGGSNAGHTVMTGDLLLKLHLIPSGILSSRTTCVISDGVVIDPSVLCRELGGLQARGIPTGNLKVSPNAHIVLPYHKEIDRLEERRRGQGKIGTTMQGVGPAYSDKARRIGLRVCDLVDEARLKAGLRTVLSEKNFLIQHLYESDPMDPAPILEEYSGYGRMLAPYVADTSEIVYEASRAGLRLVFEGAQGTMLDIDHGTYPYVTSSHPVAGGACLGTGIGPRAITSVIGVCKSYTTRVGAGTFPTEQENAIGERIRERGHEYGTTTGRPRRVGWLDLVGLRYAVRVNGLDWLALTLLDVLSGLDEVRICVAYQLDGAQSQHLPADRQTLDAVEPVYEVIEGWSEEISGVRSFDELPLNARRYVERVEELSGVPVGLVSVGKRREETIIRRPEMLL